MNLYKYNIVIHKSDDIQGSLWKSNFCKIFKSFTWSYDFELDGQLWYGKKPIGLYEFIDIQQIEKNNKIYNNNFLLKSKCPYIGAPIGIFTWEWYDEKLENKVDAATCLAYAGGGKIFKSNSDEYFDPIIKLKYPLSDINNKYGFEEAGVFLNYIEDKEKYIQSIKQKIITALEQLELKGSFITYGTSHNWMQINEVYPEEKFKNTLIEFWGFDMGLYENKNFEAFLTSD